MLAATAALLAGAATASAGVSISVSPAVPSSVTVGDNVPTSLTIQNGSFNGPGETNFNTDSFQVNDITLVPSCGSPALSADCQAGSFDPGVLVPSATGSGLAGSACAGRTFTIALIDAAQGKYRFTPDFDVVLGPSGGPSAVARCVINFTTSVPKAPAVDSAPAPGLQTDQKAFAKVESITVGSPNFGTVGSGIGTAETTVSRVATGLTTSASADITLGAGTLSDTATVSGGLSPTGNVTFKLYGPGDSACTGAAVFTDAEPVNGNGVYPSAAFTPTQAGTYRWIAAYSGDGANQPVSGSCNDANESVIVSPPPRSLGLSTAGSGSGTVDSSPTGIDCGRNVSGHADCAKSYADGTAVTLTAHPSADTDFAGFTGDCAGTGLTCTTTMDRARAVTATFTLKQRSVAVLISGDGSGSVSSTPAGIDCPADCDGSFDQGSEVTLTAHPDADSDFGGFSGGGCSGEAATCTITVGADAAAIDARFTTRPAPTDDTPPETEITRMPSNPRPKRTHFNFVSSEPGSTFTCQIDEQAPQPCSAPGLYRGLEHGRHTFAVFATDPAGNADPTPARVSFRVRRARHR